MHRLAARLHAAVARSVRAKLLLLLLPLAVVGLGASTAISVSRATSTARSDSYTEARTVASREAGTVAARLDHYTSIVETVATMFRSYRGDDRRALNLWLREVAVRYPDLNGIYWQSEPNAAFGRDSAFRGRADAGSTQRGVFAPYWERLKGTLGTEALSTEYTLDWYTIPKRSGHFEVIEPYLYQGVLMTSFVDPVRRDGRFVGAAGADVSLATLDREIRSVRFLRSGYAFLVSRKGTFVAGVDRKLLGKKRLTQIAALRPLTGAARAHATQVALRDPFTGKQAEVFSAPVGTSGWTLYLVAPASEMLSGAVRLQWILLAAGLAALALLTVSIWLVATRITRPLVRVSAAAERLAVGDVDVDVEARSEDEVGRTARAFAHIADYQRELSAVAERIAAGDLRATVEPRSDADTLGRSIRRMADDLRRMIGNVSGSAETVAASSAAVSVSSRQTGKAVEDVAKAASDVAAGAERQAQMVERAAEGARDAAEAATRAAALAESGVSAIADAGEATDAVAATAGDVSGLVARLDTSAEQIEGIVDTITGISQQTNLLALNAAIEAARAGEQGRGFAVVAEQVRKLAEEAGAAAASIAELIERVQGEVREMARVSDHRNDLATTASEKQGAAVAAFHEIVASVETVQTRIAEIAAATTEIASVAEQSAASAQEVSASSQQTSASAQEIAATAQELASTSEHLERLVAAFEL